MTELFARNRRFELADGTPFAIRGVSHHGFNTGSSLPANRDDNNPYNMPTGLWNQRWRAQIDDMATFSNVVRLCVSPETLHSTTTYRQGGRWINHNTDILDWTPREFLGEWLGYAHGRGLTILPDLHQISGLDRNNVWPIYDPAEAARHVWSGQPYTVDDWVEDNCELARLSLTFDNIIGLEPFNEPHGWARWGRGDKSFDDQAVGNPQLRYWGDDLARAARAIHAINPALLIFVQGTDNNFDVPNGNPDSWPLPWAGCFKWLAQYGIDVPRDKLVLAPHLYGPDVARRQWGYGKLWDDPNFPRELRGWLAFLLGEVIRLGYPICPTEMGGRLGTADPLDTAANEEIVRWLREHGINSGFWWTYYNSGDSGAIIEDGPAGLVRREDKIALLHRLTAPLEVPVPEPSPEPVPLPTPIPPLPIDELALETWVRAIARDEIRKAGQP